VKELIFATSFVQHEKALKSPNLLPKDYRQMSKKEEFFEVADKIIEALDEEVVPFSDLAKIACRGKTKQRCSQCQKEIVVQGIFLEDLPVRPAAAEIIFNPIENQRYICESSECYKKEKRRNDDMYDPWVMAVTSTAQRLYRTRCDHSDCFLLAPPKEVHRSKCLTKIYCSQVCRDADDAVHKVCCNPDKSLRKVEERKIKVGGQERVDAANALTDRMAERSKLLPAIDKRLEEILKETKKVKLSVKLPKGKKTRSDEVD